MTLEEFERTLRESEIKFKTSISWLDISRSEIENRINKIL